ncbi:hypothetical protein BU17DRAFT_71447 [Hysterangium stoloniferum]|nr:hypothetical protein BU17DRAFT_71447 [Hysterangium stoloniferum]
MSNTHTTPTSPPLRFPFLPPTSLKNDRTSMTRTHPTNYPAAIPYVTCITHNSINTTTTIKDSTIITGTAPSPATFTPNMFSSIGMGVGGMAAGAGVIGVEELMVTSMASFPVLHAYDATAHYLDQGGNKCCGTFAIYIEPWHVDIFEFIDLRKNHVTCYDSLKRFQVDSKWLLFCPNEPPGLHQVHCAKFVALY